MMQRQHAGKRFAPYLLIVASSLLHACAPTASGKLSAAALPDYGAFTASLKAEPNLDANVAKAMALTPGDYFKVMNSQMGSQLGQTAASSAWLIKLAKQFPTMNGMVTAAGASTALPTEEEYITAVTLAQEVADGNTAALAKFNAADLTKANSLIAKISVYAVHEKSSSLALLDTCPTDNGDSGDTSLDLVTFSDDTKTNDGANCGTNYGSGKKRPSKPVTQAQIDAKALKADDAFDRCYMAGMQNDREVALATCGYWNFDASKNGVFTN